jgi:formate dehydrogenase subunit delta
MNAQQLVNMANDISQFFSAGAGEELAAQEAAGHIKRVWEPRMRQQIIDIYKTGTGEFTPVARAAIALIAAAANPSR